MDENDYIYLLLAFILGYFAKSIIKQMCGQNIEGFDEPVVKCDPSPKRVCARKANKECITDNDCSCLSEDNLNTSLCRRKKSAKNYGNCVTGPKSMCPDGTPCPTTGPTIGICPSGPPREKKEIIHNQTTCNPKTKPPQICPGGHECPEDGLCPVPCGGLKGGGGKINCGPGKALNTGNYYNTSDPQEQQDSCCVQSCTSAMGGGENCHHGATLVKNADTIYPEKHGVNGGCCEYLDISAKTGDSLANLLNDPDYKCGSSPGEQCMECGGGEFDEKKSKDCPVIWRDTKLNDERWKQHLRKYYPDESGNYGILCGVTNKWETYIPPSGEICWNPFDYDCRDGKFEDHQKIFHPNGKKCAIP